MNNDNSPHQNLEQAKHGSRWRKCNVVVLKHGRVVELQLL